METDDPSRGPGDGVFSRDGRQAETSPPGLALAITSEDRLLFAGHYGHADLGDGRPVMPFPRRVTRTLGTALQAARVATDAVRSEEADPRVFAQHIDAGVTANLCESIQGMLGAPLPDQALKLEIMWASTMPVAEGPTRVSFGTADSASLRQAARFLSAELPEAGKLITGVVERLHRPADLIDGDVTVSCVLEGRPRQLLVRLPAQDYDLAITAHREKRPVLFVADVVLEGRRYVAQAIRDFRLADQAGSLLLLLARWAVAKLQ